MKTEYSDFGNKTQKAREQPKMSVGPLLQILFFLSTVCSREGSMLAKFKPAVMMRVLQLDQRKPYLMKVLWKLLLER